MSEQSSICAAKPLKPISRPFGFVTQPLVLPARPANDIDVDPLEGRAQLRPIELAVVVDPACDVRIVRLGQIWQGLVAVMVKSPTPDRPADGRERFRAGRGQEASKRTTSPPQCFPNSPAESLGGQDIPIDHNHAPAAMRTVPARGAIMRPKEVIFSKRTSNARRSIQ